jgi:hypothetical protein
LRALIAEARLAAAECLNTLPMIEARHCDRGALSWAAPPRPGGSGLADEDHANLLRPATRPPEAIGYAALVLRHVNLLTWKDGTEQVAIDALSKHLSGYAGEIPEIRDLSFGSDLGLAERNVDFAIIVDFDDEEAFSRYLAHPAHGRMVGEFFEADPLVPPCDSVSGLGREVALSGQGLASA